MEFLPNQAERLQELEREKQRFAGDWEGHSRLMSIPLAVVKIVFILALAFELYTVMSAPKTNWMFFDWANLGIHEFGHMVFLPFGQFIMIAGGTILQLGVPLALTTYFFISGRKFSALFGVFWVGDNLVNIYKYIADARAQALSLVSFMGTGDKIIHDWNYLLGQMRLLPYDLVIGTVVYWAGIIIMVVALLLMLGESFRRVIWKQGRF